MNRRSFLKILATVPFLSLSPVRRLLAITSPESERLTAGTDTFHSFTPEELDALQKIKYFQAQLQQQKERFSWYLHNELRHYWGAFSEEKSLSHANIILEYSIMDAYILNTLSDWYYAPDYQPCQPELALASLQRRAENYPDLPYLRVACWLRAGQISYAIGEGNLARRYYQNVFDISEEFGQKASRLWLYQHLAQTQLAEMA